MELLGSYISAFAFSPIQLFVVAFIGVLFLGEPAVLSLSFLSAAGTLLLPLWQIMVIGYVTSILGEMFWFLVGRSRWANLIARKHSESVTGEDFRRYIATIERGNPLRLLFLVRFIFGLSIVVVIYMSRQNLSTKRFLLYCLLINAFWTPVFVLLGFAAGEGYSILLTGFENLRLAIEIGLGALIVVYIFSRIFGKKPWQK